MTPQNTLPPLTLGTCIAAMGVVFGDIGTSPLYALKICFSSGHFSVDPVTIFGVVSLIFWTLVLIVCMKYAGFILKADNNKEGGMLALSALLTSKKKKKSLIFVLGLIGFSLFFGDGIITPAISVLSALEGLSVISSDLSQSIVPVAIVILLGLFLAQRKGTAKIGRFFGPIMAIWFLVLGGLGIINIIHHPMILKAINPLYMIDFFLHFGLSGFVIFGAVVLAITGAEALYADLGHFGRPVIVRTWYMLPFPGLALNYFGQGALLLENPHFISNPFYHMGPEWSVLPLTILATIATVIASQSIISGVFSVTWQAVQLGYLPRLQIVHTSTETIGQVFIPFMNQCLLLLTVLLVVLFENSDNLAEAYGFSVVSVMLITTFLTGLVSHRLWKWPIWKSVSIFGFFFTLETGFFIENVLKIFHGAWIPIVVGGIVYMIVSTWIKGRSILSDELHTGAKTLKTLIKHLQEEKPLRVRGIGVYMTAVPHHIPKALKINLKHNQVLHEKLVMLSVLTTETPRVHRSKRLEVEYLGESVYQVIAYYGFMEIPNIHHIAEQCMEYNLEIPVAETSFFLSRGIPIASERAVMNVWQEKIFILLSRNALNAADFFKIPHNRVIEIGARVKI